MPTAITPLETGNTVTKVFVAGFGSDRIGVLRPTNPATPETWPRSWIDLPASRVAQGYTRSGPRALVLKQPAPSVPGDPGRRLYCLNQLEQTIAVIDPDAEAVVTRVSLGGDPTPTVVRSGRELLYSADLSASGFVSCASCHVDGRTDQLVWVLGEILPGDGPLLPAELLDGVTQRPGAIAWPRFKGPLVTQSLQGLVDSPHDGTATFALSNAPYHWRGDRAAVNDFNGAFVTLMGRPNLGTPAAPKGVGDARMDEMRRFLNTIQYPPNPEQPVTRLFGGSFGTPDLEDGVGAQRGLKLFHTRGITNEICAGRSCAGCHFLPEGSNSRVAQFPLLQPLETPGLRGMLRKEALLESGVQVHVAPTVIGQFGLTSDGDVPFSINRFVSAAFLSQFRNQHERLSDLIAFMRQFDTGTAPVIGSCALVDLSNRGSAAVASQLDLMERQVDLVNAGLAVQAILATGPRGLFWDVSASPPAYRTPDLGQSLSRAQVLALLTASGERLIFQSTPLPEARRFATLGGQLPALTGPAPSAIELVGLEPALHWRDVPRLTKNWLPGGGPDNFVWTGEMAPGVPAAEPISLKAMRIANLALASLSGGFAPIVAYDFQATPAGWTVANTSVTAGAWVRATPTFGTRNDPPRDHDGSGACWVTGSGQDEDLDGGPTQLSTETFDLSATVDPHVVFARWMQSVTGTTDFLDVEISSNAGSSWTVVEHVGHNASGWVVRRFRIRDFASDLSRIRFRFTVGDQPNNSVTEAAIDAFRIEDAVSFGVVPSAHDAPRRLQLVGNDIRHGAMVEIGIPVDQPSFFDARGGSVTTLQMPLFPTSRTLLGRRVWETAAEFDPLTVRMLLLGGPRAPGLTQLLRGAVAEPPAAGTFDASWNRYRLRVVNTDTTAATSLFRKALVLR
jgi:hypothetical protein